MGMLALEALSPGRGDTTVAFDNHLSPLPGLLERSDPNPAVSPRATNRSPLRGLGRVSQLTPCSMERHCATGTHATPNSIAFTSVGFLPS